MISFKFDFQLEVLGPDLLRSQIVGTKLRARCNRQQYLNEGFACLNGEFGRVESCKRKMKCDMVLVEKVNKYTKTNITRKTDIWEIIIPLQNYNTGGKTPSCAYSVIVPPSPPLHSDKSHLSEVRSWLIPALQTSYI